MKSEDKIKEQSTKEVKALSTPNIESEVTGDRYQYLEGLLQVFATNSPIGIGIVRDGKIKFTNPQFRKLFGYTEDELRNMDLQDLVPEDKNLVEEAITKTLKAQVPSTYL